VTRVTLDTNELISAFNFRGKALELIHRAINGEIEIAISEPIPQETMRVLRDKFEWNPYELRALHDSLIKICKLVEPKHALAVVADEPDNHILECSEEAGSEFIITEDRALLRVKEHAGAKLVRAADFLAGGLRR
jgi:putative PIN family toxin of toxin-antitoxin system